mmetsp:Transcript_120341/g.323040  ORF Transcript_120341/g.323040 Transcript_120341/m.323040 type:complete len:280 (-) Transcript_120341:1321-2160(-)
MDDVRHGPVDGHAGHGLLRHRLRLRFLQLGPGQVGRRLPRDEVSGREEHSHQDGPEGARQELAPAVARHHQGLHHRGRAGRRGAGAGARPGAAEVCLAAQGRARLRHRRRRLLQQRVRKFHRGRGHVLGRGEVHSFRWTGGHAEAPASVRHFGIWQGHLYPRLPGGRHGPRAERRPWDLPAELRDGLLAARVAQHPQGWRARAYPPDTLGADFHRLQQGRADPEGPPVAQLAGAARGLHRHLVDRRQRQHPAAPASPPEEAQGLAGVPHKALGACRKGG